MAVRVLVSFPDNFVLQNRDIERLEYTQALGHHDRAHLSFFRDTSYRLTIDQIAGESCRVQVFDDDLENDPARIDFDGVVAGVTQEHQLNGGSEWRAEIVSRSVFLDADRNLRVFPEVDLGQLGPLISPLVTVDGAIAPARADYVQWGESDWEFLVRAADEAGCFVRLAAGKIEIRRGFVHESGALTWGRDLLALSLRASPRNAGAKGWAYEVAKKESYVFRDRRQDPTFMGVPTLANAVTKLARSFPSPGDPLLLDHQSRAPTLAEFRERVTAEAERAVGGAIAVEGTSTRYALRAGATIKIDDAGNFKLPHVVGEIGVVRIQHTWDGQQYRNQFVASPWEHFTNVEPPPRRVVQGLVSGECVDTNDPEGLGRVKVRLQFQEPQDPLLWMRVVAPYAGHARGIQFFPEVGDEVAIAFEQGDPARPYIMGSLWNGKDQPPDLRYKQIVTRNGSVIRMGDTTDDELIQVFTPNGKCMLQLDNQKGNAVLTIHSEGDISLEAKEQIRVKCKTFLQVVDEDYIRKAGKSEKAAAGADLTLTGGQVNVASDSTMALSAEANLDASAGAIHNVVGAMVQLNPPVFVKLPVSKAAPALAASVWASQDGAPAMTKLRTTYDPEPPRSLGAGVAAASARTVAPGGPALAFAPTTAAGTKTDWIEIRMVTKDGKPAPGLAFKIELPDGTARTGVLDENGRARYDGIEPGQCRVSFPDLDKDAWEPA